MDHCSIAHSVSTGLVSASDNLYLALVLLINACQVCCLCDTMAYSLSLSLSLISLSGCGMDTTPLRGSLL